MTDLLIYRNASLISTVKDIDEQTVLVKKIMNADRVTSTFISSTVLPLELGDYITVNGLNYYLNQTPTVDKQNETSYKYTLVFQGVLYDMFTKMLISSDGLTDFSYTADATDFLTLLVNQMNVTHTGWLVGEVDATEKKTLDFVNENCRTALTKITDAFNFEFELVGKTINLKEAIGKVTSHVFSYGKNNGLYNLVRNTVESVNLFTRVYGFGSTKNIPYTYRNHAKRLVFESKYLEKNTLVYGIREGHYTNEDIYPNRTSTLTEVNPVFDDGIFNANESFIIDDALDFDINDYLVAGLTAKIVFKTGDLSGYEFEIWKYDHDTKRMYINAYSERDGYQLPNESNVPAVGDTYTLVNIDMPPVYIIEAENALQAATQKYLDANSVPKSLYIVKLDPKYAKTNTVKLDAGDLVKIQDAFLGVDRAIRVAQISYPLVNPYKITAIIADFIPYSLQDQVTKTTTTTGKQVGNLNNTINNIVQNTINNSSTVTNNTTNNMGVALNKITINNREYFWEKGFDNDALDTLEIGDVIYGNNWSRYTFVDKWIFKGGLKELRSNWDEVETTDNTPKDE